jgi:hypothetical protein
MSADPIAPEIFDACTSVVIDALSLTRADIRAVTRQTGGLFNLVLRVETTKGVFFFKQYLDDVPNPIFKVPRIPAAERVALACEVQRLASTATQSLGEDLVPAIVHFDRQRNAFLMAQASGDSPFIGALSKGQRPNTVLSGLPKVLACLHQATFGKFAADSIFANTTFRDFKLGLQYDDIAAVLEPDEAEVVRECKSRYRTQLECVTHGDINSRNVIVGPNAMGVIDFEQSHLGTPAYDLAYILCEIFISMETFGAASEFPAVYERFLDDYFAHFNAASREAVEHELTLHLPIQTLYRFWGPSRNSWTFYVDDVSKERLIRRSRALLKKTGPLGALLHA